MKNPEQMQYAQRKEDTKECRETLGICELSGEAILRAARDDLFQLSIKSWGNNLEITKQSPYW